jgi:hypothetical protein
MAAKTHYGDEDPEFVDHEGDAEFEEELFQIAKELGHKPEGMIDEEFSARYAAWLAKQEG